MLRHAFQVPDCSPCKLRSTEYGVLRSRVVIKPPALKRQGAEERVWRYLPAGDQTVYV